MKRLLALILILSLLLTGCAYTADEPAPFEIIKGRTGDETYQPIMVDPTTHTIQVIDYTHHEVHDGNSYFLSGNDDAIDASENFTLTVVTPDTTTWLHSTWSAEGTAAIHIFVYEDVIVSVNGTIVTPVNRNRNSTNTASGIFRENDTITSSGTLLWQWHTSDRKIAGAGGERDELILKQDTVYMFVIESEVNGNAVSGILSWYEHVSLEP